MTMESPTIALNELVVAPLKKMHNNMESPISLLEQECFSESFPADENAPPGKPLTTETQSNANSNDSPSSNNATIDKENMCTESAKDLEELSQLVALGENAASADDNALKPLTQGGLLPSSTLEETFTEDTSALDALLYRLSLESSSASERQDERECLDERECSDERRDCSDDRADSMEPIPFDEMRDDGGNDPAFLQTRVTVTIPERDHTIMFLATSTESWDCHVARETSLFDDDEDSRGWQDDDDEIAYDATAEDTEEEDESTYDGSRSTTSSSLLGSGGTEYSRASPPFDPIGTIQSVFMEWADCVTGAIKK